MGAGQREPRVSKSVIFAVAAAVLHLAFGGSWVRFVVGGLAGGLAALALGQSLMAKDDDGRERAGHYAVISLSISGIGAVIYLFVSWAGRSYI